MLNRRTAVLTSVAALLPLPKALGASDQIAPTSASVSSNLTVTEQMMYSTVRIADDSTHPTRWGTGFLFGLFHTPDTTVFVIVTNKHVIEGLTKCSFAVASRKSNGSPDLDNHILVEISDIQMASLAHPTADLVIIFVGRLFDELINNGKIPFVVTLSPELIPTTDELKSLMPVEQILTVGYPGVVWDDVHNLPVFHRGYTATAPYIDFKGRKEFLIDIATWPGASGSPVMLFNDSGWITRNGGTVLGGPRIKLLGIVYGVAAQDVSGAVAIQAGPYSDHSA